MNNPNAKCPLCKMQLFTLDQDGEVWSHASHDMHECLEKACHGRLFKEILFDSKPWIDLFDISEWEFGLDEEELSTKPLKSMLMKAAALGIFETITELQIHLSSSGIQCIIGRDCELIYGINLRSALSYVVDSGCKDTLKVAKSTLREALSYLESLDQSKYH